jgi:microcystin-dependent protein
MNVAPLGWLVCDGTSYATATYPGLFAAIQYLHGGTGANFNVPDMRGVMPRGWDNGRGLDPARVFASYQADMFASHTHVQNAHNHATTESPHSHTYQAGGGSTAAVGGGVIAGDLPGQTTTAVATGLTINNATAVNQVTGGTETTSKNLALLFCIRT